MEIIQQIAAKAVEEIYETVKVTGLNDIGKTVKALTPVVSRTVLNVVTSFLEDMDEALVTRAKALRREDGITVKERLTIKSQVFEGRNPKEVLQTTAAFDKQHSSAEIGRARAMEGTANKATAALAKRECST